MVVRVLHILDKISVDSGISSVVMNYYNKLDHNRLTFDFMLNEDLDPGTRAHLEGNGSGIYVMPGLRPANIFKYIGALKEFYKGHDYKIIHGHVANSAILYLRLAKNVPCRILHSHSIRSSDIFWKGARNWLLTRLARQAANLYAACSEEAAIFLFGEKNNAFILNNAIDGDKFLFNAEIRENTRRELGLEGKLVIGHVGRFSAVKNHAFIIEVFCEVFKINNHARLMLIGAGGLYRDIVRKTEKLGIREAVVFVGAADNVGAYMSAMDIFVLPSVFEGFGMVGIEAQAAGLYVLASVNVPGMIDFTGNVEFLRFDKFLWARKLLGAHTALDRTGQGKKIKGGRFDIETQAMKLCGYYEKLLDGVH